MGVFRQVEAKKGVLGITGDAEGRITRLRELSYLQTFDRWHAPDLAAYVSDDFGLIGDALATGVSHPWLNALLHKYWTGEFPHGAIPEREGELATQIH